MIYALMPLGVVMAVEASLDFGRFLTERGLTFEQMRLAKERMPTPLPLPKWAEERVRVDRPSIEGDGLFSQTWFAKGQTIAPAMVSGMWTKAGRYANHWPYPNAAVEGNQESLTFIALRPIEKDEEITVNYRQVAQILQPINMEAPQEIVV